MINQVDFAILMNVFNKAIDETQTKIFEALRKDNYTEAGELSAYKRGLEQGKAYVWAWENNIK